MTHHINFQGVLRPPMRPQATQPQETNRFMVTYSDGCELLRVEIEAADRFQAHDKAQDEIPPGMVFTNLRKLPARAGRRQ